MLNNNELYSNAKLLKSDSGENLEYDRALIELISYTTGEDFDKVASKLEIINFTEVTPC